MNTCYKHFVYFVKEFDLVSSKEFEPLKEMTARICNDDDTKHPSTALTNNVTDN